jgi:multimeric flavodoxin WrbA
MKALLLVGSPRKGKSASETLGAYLLGQLENNDIAVDKAYVYPAIKSEEKLEALVKTVATADVVIIAAPLYVDSLPAAVIKLLEVLSRDLGQYTRPDHQLLLAISNGGFPEASQNDIALAIYRRFAEETGFVWAGGMAVGGGEALKGRPLEASGGMARNVVAGLDMAAAALAEGNPVPQEAEELVSEPMMPSRIYRLMGNLGWWMQAGEYGTRRKLRTRVWEQ